MGWILLLIAGVIALSTMEYFWGATPSVGLAAALGYLCGAMRCRKPVSV